MEKGAGGIAAAARETKGERNEEGDKPPVPGGRRPGARNRARRGDYGNAGSGHITGSVTHVAKHMKQYFYTKAQSEARYANAVAGTDKANDAELLDGLDSTAFLPVAGKATDADRLDGINSTGFYAAGSKVADANLLDGVDSTGFVKGSGNVYQNIFRPTAYVNYGLLSVPGFGSLLGGCNSDGESFFDFHNTSGETLDAMVDTGGSNPVHQTIANGTNPYMGSPFTTTNEAMTVQLSRSNRIATLIVSAHGVPTGTSAVSCFINAMAVTN